MRSRAKHVGFSIESLYKRFSHSTVRNRNTWSHRDAVCSFWMLLWWHLHWIFLSVCFRKQNGTEKLQLWKMWVVFQSRSIWMEFLLYYFLWLEQYTFIETHFNHLSCSGLNLPFLKFEYLKRKKILTKIFPLWNFSFLAYSAWSTFQIMYGSVSLFVIQKEVSERSSKWHFRSHKNMGKTSTIWLCWLLKVSLKLLRLFFCFFHVICFKLDMK